MSSPAPIVHGSQEPEETERSGGGIDESGRIFEEVNYRVWSLQQAVYWEPPAHPLGLEEVSRRWTHQGCEEMALTVRFEGRLADEDGDTGDYSLDASFAEEPIESHPELDAILKQYQGRLDPESGKAVFTPFVTDDATIGLGAQGPLQKGKSRKKNPLYKQSTYLVLRAVLRHTYQTSARPRLNRLGAIVDSVPGGFSTPDDRNWLVTPPKARKQGRKGKFQTTDEYLLSKPGGWPEGLYRVLGFGTDDPSDDFMAGEEPAFGAPGAPGVVDPSF